MVHLWSTWWQLWWEDLLPNDSFTHDCWFCSLLPSPKLSIPLSFSLSLLSISPLFSLWDKSNSRSLSTAWASHGSFQIVHKTVLFLSYIYQLQYQDHIKVFHEQLILTKSVTMDSFTQCQSSAEYLSTSHMHLLTHLFINLFNKYLLITYLSTAIIEIYKAWGG